MRAATPTLIAGRYDVGELLGRGGMAEVYAGIDRRLSRPVAIKLLQDSMAARDEVRVRFEAEARAAAAILQPHAVAVYDSGEHEGVPYIVMERLPGDTLADRIASGPVLTEGEARTYGRQVLGALDAAHHVGMIHRDVKPGNILLTGEGSVKIADFGIAKSLDVGADLTGTGQLIGTPAYLAPEQLGGSPASPASDVYALGVVLYEALAGRKPFEGANSMATARAIVDGNHPPLGTLRPDLEPSLVRAVARAMSNDPGARFPSAAAMAAALAPPAVPTVVPVAGAGAGAGALDATLLGPDPTDILDVAEITPAAAAAAPRAVAARPADAAPVVAAPPVPLAAGPKPGFPIRVLLALVAVIAILFLLVQVVRALPDGTIDEADLRTATSTSVPSTAAPTTAAPSAASTLATALRSGAGGRGVGEGAAAPELAARMRAVADQVERGDSAASGSATALIVDVARWRLAGQLTDGATVTAVQLLQQVPGVAIAGSVDALLNPPSAIVVPNTPGNGNGKDKKDDKGRDD